MEVFTSARLGRMVRPDRAESDPSCCITTGDGWAEVVLYRGGWPGEQEFWECVCGCTLFLAPVGRNGHKYPWIVSRFSGRWTSFGLSFPTAEGAMRFASEQYSTRFSARTDYLWVSHDVLCDGRGCGEQSQLLIAAEEAG